ncbi:AAEL013157-PA [Aedes aegypti]|nr:AAEL013157-PA [Aedes aegypti]
MSRKPVSSYQDPLKTPKYIVYPSNSQSIDNGIPLKTDGAMDRFAPGEAYGGTVYKIVKARENKIKYGYQYQKPNAASFDDGIPRTTASPPIAVAAPSLPPPVTSPPIPVFIAGPTPNPSPPSVATAPATAAPAPGASSESTPSSQYIPPSDLNLFAPNIHSHYPPPADGDVRFNGVSSYLPPPAGTPDDAPSVDSGPQPVSSADSVLSAPTQPASAPPSNQYIPPDSLFQFPPNIHSHYHPPPTTDFQPNGISSYLPPPAGPTDSYLPPPSGDSSNGPSPGPSDANDMIGTIPVGPNSPYYSYLPPSQPATPSPMTMQQMPPQMMMGMPLPNNMMPMGMPPAAMAPFEMGRNPPIDFDFHGYYPHDHFPEYIFDHDHDHDHFHDEPTTTTPAPPPPPPPKPPKRVKNFSYYYVTRFFWYIPLYFSLYMLFYVLVLILRFVARRKVNYPNQWTGRSLGEIQYLTNDQAVDKADVMTGFVMKQIEDFKEKYL